MKPRNDADQMMALDRVFYCIEALGGAGVKEINLSGGEPFLHPNLDMIVDRIIQQGMDVGVLTNGWLHPGWLASCSKKTSFQISLDGASSSTHDSFRGVVGSHRRAITLAEYLVREGFDVAFAATLHKNNIHEISEMVGIASRIGCAISARRLIPSQYHGPEVKSLYLDMQECAGAFHELCSSAKKRQVTLLSHDPLEILSDLRVANGILEKAEREIGMAPAGGCSAGLDGFFISVSGDLQACPAILTTLGNVFTDDLVTVWRNSQILSTLRRRNLLEGRCGECTYRNICGGCRAHALAESGNLMGEDPVCWMPRIPCRKASSSARKSPRKGAT